MLLIFSFLIAMQIHMCLQCCNQYQRGTSLPKRCRSCPSGMHLYRFNCIFDLPFCLKYSNGFDCIQCQKGYKYNQKFRNCIPLIQQKQKDTNFSINANDNGMKRISMSDNIRSSSLIQSITTKTIQMLPNLSNISPINIYQIRINNESKVKALFEEDRGLIQGSFSLKETAMENDQYLFQVGLTQYKYYQLQKDQRFLQRQHPFLPQIRKYLQSHPSTLQSVSSRVLQLLDIFYTRSISGSPSDQKFRIMLDNNGSIYQLKVSLQEIVSSEEKYKNIKTEYYIQSNITRPVKLDLVRVEVMETIDQYLKNKGAIFWKVVKSFKEGFDQFKVWYNITQKNKDIINQTSIELNKTVYYVFTKTENTRELKLKFINIESYKSKQKYKVNCSQPVTIPNLIDRSPIDFISLYRYQQENISNQVQKQNQTQQLSKLGDKTMRIQSLLKDDILELYFYAKRLIKCVYLQEVENYRLQSLYVNVNDNKERYSLQDGEQIIYLMSFSHQIDDQVKNKSNKTLQTRKQTVQQTFQLQISPALSIVTLSIITHYQNLQTKKEQKVVTSASNQIPAMKQYYRLLYQQSRTYNRDQFLNMRLDIYQMVSYNRYNTLLPGSDRDPEPVYCFRFLFFNPLNPFFSDTWRYQWIQFQYFMVSFHVVKIFRVLGKNDDQTVFKQYEWSGTGGKNATGAEVASIQFNIMNKYRQYLKNNNFLKQIYEWWLLRIYQQSVGNEGENSKKIRFLIKQNHTCNYINYNYYQIKSNLLSHRPNTTNIINGTNERQQITLVTSFQGEIGDGIVGGLSDWVIFGRRKSDDQPNNNLYNTSANCTCNASSNISSNNSASSKDRKTDQNGSKISNSSSQSNSSKSGFLSNGDPRLAPKSSIQPVTTNIYSDPQLFSTDIIPPEIIYSTQDLYRIYTIVQKSLFGGNSKGRVGPPKNNQFHLLYVRRVVVLDTQVIQAFNTYTKNPRNKIISNSTMQQPDKCFYQLCFLNKSSSISSPSCILVFFIVNIKNGQVFISQQIGRQISIDLFREAWKINNFYQLYTKKSYSIVKMANNFWEKRRDIARMQFFSNQSNMNSINNDIQPNQQQKSPLSISAINVSQKYQCQVQIFQNITHQDIQSSNITIVSASNLLIYQQDGTFYSFQQFYCPVPHSQYLQPQPYINLFPKIYTIALPVPQVKTKSLIIIVKSNIYKIFSIPIDQILIVRVAGRKTVKKYYDLFVVDFLRDKINNNNNSSQNTNFNIIEDNRIRLAKILVQNPNKLQNVQRIVFQVRSLGYYFQPSSKKKSEQIKPVETLKKNSSSQQKLILKDVSHQNSKINKINTSNQDSRQRKILPPTVLLKKSLSSLSAQQTLSEQQQIMQQIISQQMQQNNKAQKQVQYPVQIQENGWQQVQQGEEGQDQGQQQDQQLQQEQQQHQEQTSTQKTQDMIGSMEKLVYEVNTQGSQLFNTDDENDQQSRDGRTRNNDYIDVLQSSGHKDIIFIPLQYYPKINKIIEEPSQEKTKPTFMYKWEANSKSQLVPPSQSSITMVSNLFGAQASAIQEYQIELLPDYNHKIILSRHQKYGNTNIYVMQKKNSQLSDEGNSTSFEIQKIVFSDRGYLIHGNSYAQLHKHYKVLVGKILENYTNNIINSVNQFYKPEKQSSQRSSQKKNNKNSNKNNIKIQATNNSRQVIKNILQQVDSKDLVFWKLKYLDSNQTRNISILQMYYQLYDGIISVIGYFVQDYIYKVSPTKLITKRNLTRNPPPQPTTTSNSISSEDTDANTLNLNISSNISTFQKKLLKAQIIKYDILRFRFIKSKTEELYQQLRQQKVNRIQAIRQTKEYNAIQEVLLSNYMAYISKQSVLIYLNQVFQNYTAVYKTLSGTFLLQAQYASKPIISSLTIFTKSVKQLQLLEDCKNYDYFNSNCVQCKDGFSRTRDGRCYRSVLGCLKQVYGICLECLGSLTNKNFICF